MRSGGGTGFAPPEALGPPIAEAVRRHVAQSDLLLLRQDLRQANPLEWIEGLIARGVPADVGRPLTFRGREFWRPIYEASADPTMVLKSAAQVGKSIWAMYTIAGLAHRDHYAGRGSWIGFYLPTQEMVRAFSRARLAQILTAVGRVTGVPCGDAEGDVRAGFDRDTVAALGAILALLPAHDGGDDDAAGRALAAAEAAEQRDVLSAGGRRSDSFNLKQIADSFVLLGWIGGLGIDAFPLDRLLLDEVRLMDPSRVDRVEKRVMGSDIGSICYTSTAGMPGDAIDVRWQQSKQAQWHHPCACPDGVELNHVWPACLAERPKEADPVRRYYLRCPRCNVEIHDRATGRWIEHAPENNYRGFSPHQLMTRRPLHKIADDWNRIDRDTGEFHRSVLGIEWVDPEAVPVTPEALRACVDQDLLWAEPGETVNTAMGVDHGGGYNHYVICGRAPSGKRRLLHVEVTFDPDPFRRAAQLMDEYDVAKCCLEPLPNYNEAHRFAREFPGRVHLVHWLTGRDYPKGGKAIVWLDRPESDEERKTAAEAKFKYTARAHRNTILDMMTRLWVDRGNECPEPKALLQQVQDPHGRWATVCLGEDVYFDHLQRLARRRRRETLAADDLDTKEETGLAKYHWAKLARSPFARGRPVAVAGNAADPHFAFAEALSVVAYTRLPRRNQRIRGIY